MSELTDWQSGKRCEKHDLMFCADCLEQSKMRRKSDGTVAYDNDCAVQTYVELTGADYETAAAVLKAAGYNPSKGTPNDSLMSVFKSAGYTVTGVTRTIRYDDLVYYSSRGRKFFVTGRKGNKGHAWSVIDGKANRPLHPPFRYNAYEVKEGK